MTSKNHMFEQHVIADATKLSRALFASWTSLDSRLSLPGLVMRQIDGLRPETPWTRPIREYFEEVCYESLILGGSAWDPVRRKALPDRVRSEYLESLVRKNLETNADFESESRIADPAYRRWARLKYASIGTEERSLWERFLWEAKEAATVDCSSLQTSSPGSSPKSTISLVRLRQSFAQAFARQGLSIQVLANNTPGFTIRTLLEFQGYYIDCSVRDIQPLIRRIVPFNFEVASIDIERRLRISGDRSVWPGCAEYRNACSSNSMLDGLGSVLALFVRSLVDAVANI